MVERRSTPANPCQCFQVEHPCFIVVVTLFDEIASIHVLSDLKIFISSSDHLRSLNQFCANFLSFTREWGMFVWCIHPYFGTGHVIISDDALRRRAL